MGDEPYNAVYIGIKGKLTGANLKPESPLSSKELAKILEYAGEAKP